MCSSPRMILNLVISYMRGAARKDGGKKVKKFKIEFSKINN